MNISTVRRYRKKHRYISTLLRKNPVLVLGLDLPFVIATAFSLKNAVALSIEMFLIHLSTMMVAMITCRYLPNWSRIPVNTIFATGVMVCARAMIMQLYPNVLDSAGIYIYLMAVNGMTLLQAGFLNRKQKLWPVLSTAFMNALAFAIIMLGVSLLREYFGNNTLWGIPVAAPIRLNGMLLPFFGFVLMGCLLAGAKFLNKKMLAYGLWQSARREAPYTNLPSAKS